VICAIVYYDVVLRIIDLWIWVSFNVNAATVFTHAKCLARFLIALLFYARKQPLLLAHLSHRNSVRLSVRHASGSVKNGAS